MMTGFQTGLIDSTYAPVILAEGYQFYRQVPFMTDMKWAPLQGAVVMHERGWNQLSEEQQEEMLRITRFEELFEIHEDEDAALASF